MVTRESAVLPIHDPTARTTDQLRHELDSLKNLIEYRLDGMDTATKLLHENMTRFPTEIDKQVGHARELFNERFLSIERRFGERDIRVRTYEEASRLAVNAALQAQKEAAAAQNTSNAEAIGKSEAATTKQIDGIHALLAGSTKAMDEKISGITARLDRGEGHSRGLGDGWGYLAGAVGVLVAIVSVVLALNKG